MRVFHVSPPLSLSSHQTEFVIKKRPTYRADLRLVISDLTLVEQYWLLTRQQTKLVMMTPTSLRKASDSQNTQNLKGFAHAQ